MKKRNNFLFATGDVAALNFEAAERRFYAAAESAPWDRARRTGPAIGLVKRPEVSK